MRKDVLICALGFLVLAGACQKEAEFQTDDTVKSVTFTITDFTDGDADTKTSFNEGGGFLWAPNDTVGIYPDTGSQVWFELTAGAEASSAQFDGGGWAFKASSMYYSYYPFIGDIYLDRNHIPISYVGQKQTGTVSTSHIGPFDFMYTPGASSSSGNVNFRYRHLNSLLYVTATLPAGTYRKLAITAPTECFVEKGWYDLMADQPAIVAETHTNQMLINLENITLSEQTTFRVYLMLAPVNLNGVEVTVSVLNSRNKELQCKKTPSREYVAGSYYGLTCSAFTQVPASEALIEIDEEPEPLDPNIVFADEKVKSICVARWDTNKDGELSYEEATAVSSLYGFVSRTDIVSFDELKYFTGLTEISNSVFSGCTSLSSIILPKTITSIGNYAFRSCSSIYSINLPENLTSIGESAFYDCSNLQNIILPQGVTALKDCTFQGCSKLQSINTENITYLGFQVFSGCSGLKSVVISDDLSYLGAYAFSGCSSISSPISLPNSITTIPSNTFASCESIPSITISNSVSSIGNFAFSNCQSITSFSIPESVIEIGDHAFESCSQLRDIVIPEGITVLKNGVFMQCYSLQTVSLPSSLQEIGSGAFRSCRSLSSISIPNAVTIIGGQAFYACGQLESVVIPVGVSEIGQETFYGCTLLKTVNLPSGIKSIGSKAFSRSGLLTSIELPESMESIGTEAFADCSNLTIIRINASTPPNGGNNMFYNTNECPIYVPRASVDIYKTATYWSSYSDRIQAIEEDPGSSNLVFADENVKSICVANWDTNNDGELSYAEAAAVKSIDTIFAGENIISFDEFQYFTGLDGIGETAFANCNKLKSITLPSTIISIGKAAFSYCAELSSITIPATVREIGEDTFLQSGLQSVWFEDGCEEIPNNMFNYCRSLSSVRLPNTLKRFIGQTGLSGGTFEACTLLEEISLPYGLEEIGGATFNACFSLKRINIPETVTKIGPGAFASCTSLAVFQGDYGSNDNRLLVRNGKLVAVAPAGITNGQLVITDMTITSIASNTFSGVSTLNHLELPSSIRTIEAGAFIYCHHLQSVNIPPVLSIEPLTFSGTEISSIVIPSTVTSIGNFAFTPNDFDGIDGSGTLKTVRMEAATPPTLSLTAFDSFNNKSSSPVIIYVPQDSYSLYANALNWSLYNEADKLLPY